MRLDTFTSLLFIPTTKEKIMKCKLFTIILLISCVFAFSISNALAAESPTCDEGPIRDVEVRIGGMWFTRPDSRIDGFPITDSLGPFQVHARLIQDSGVAAVKLYYSSEGSNYPVVQMSIDGSYVSGVIPKMRDLDFGLSRIHFYLRAYDEEGGQIWIDEIPYSCDPYTHGDPYNFRILVPAPFGGTWMKISHQPRIDPQLHILEQRTRSSSSGVIIKYYVLYTGPKGNITVDPSSAELVEWNRIETDTHSYEYDQNTGYLHETNGTVNVYVKRGK